MRSLLFPLLGCALVGPLSSCAWLRPKPPEYDPIRLESGLIVHDLVVPEGGEIARRGDRVTICYTIRLEDWTPVDSSLDRGQPVGFRIGDGEVPVGLEQGVEGMRLFGRRELLVPPDLAYGAEGMPPLIPPDATLRFEIELMTIERPPEGLEPASAEP